MKKTTCFILSLIFLITCCFTDVFSMNLSVFADSEPVRVLISSTNNSGYLCEENGEYKGYYIDYLNEIAKYTGWSYEYIVPQTNEEFVGIMESGDYDIMPGIVYSQEYDDTYFDYPLYTIGARRYVLATLKTNSQIYGNDYLTLKGIKIAVTTSDDDTLEIRFKSFCDTNGIPYIDDSDKQFPLGINFIHMEGNERLNAVKSGQADALLTSDSFALKNEMYVATTFGMDPLYCVSPNGRNEMLLKYNQAAAQMQNTDSTFVSRLYEQFFNANYNHVLSFNEEENALLSSTKKYKVALLNNRAPYSYIDNGNNQCGLMIEVMKQISEKTHNRMQFEFVFYDYANDAIAALNKGECDMMGFRMLSTSMKNDTESIRSLTFYTDKYCIFKNKYISTSLESGRIAVSSEVPNEILDSLSVLSNTNLIKMNTIEECMSAVNNGQADFAISLANIADYYISCNYLSNIEKLSINTDSIFLNFGMNSKLPSEFSSIINKCIESLDTAVLDEYITNTLLNCHYNMSMWEFVSTHVTEVTMVFLAIMALVTLLVIIARKNRQLKKVNIAKTDFLSRMSHEMRTPLGAISGLNNIAFENANDPEYVRKCTEKIKLSTNHLLQLINDVLDMSKIGQGKMTLHNVPFDLHKTMEVIDTVYKPNAAKKSVTLSTIVAEDLPQMINADELRIKQVIINLISNAIKYNRKDGKVMLKAEKIKDLENGKVLLRFTVEDNGIGIKTENQNRIFKAFEREETLYSSQISGTGLGLSICSQIIKLMHSQLRVESQVDKGSRFWFEIEVEVQPCTQVEYNGKQIAVQDLTTVDFKQKRFLIAEDNELNAEIA